VHQAADNHEALGVLRDPARPVDIVISDLALPGEDDVAWIRRLGVCGDATPVIFAGAFDHKLLGFIAVMAAANRIKVLRLPDTHEDTPAPPHLCAVQEVPVTPAASASRIPLNTQPAAWQQPERGPGPGMVADA
jgi:hypothetical protein